MVESVSGETSSALRRILSKLGAVPTPPTESLLSRTRPTMSRLSMATTLSMGTGGWFTKCLEPSRPVSSAVKAAKTSVRAGGLPPLAAWSKYSAILSMAVVPEALSSAP
jgi:hypothetical protein